MEIKIGSSSEAERIYVDVLLHSGRRVWEEVPDSGKRWYEGDPTDNRIENY